MTLKNWKKIGKNQWKRVGINEYTIVGIGLIGKKYFVEITHEEFANTKKSFDRIKCFKTKSQALKYAKNYMKKH